MFALGLGARFASGLARGSMLTLESPEGASAAHPTLAMHVRMALVRNNL
jgi:hypothetical protein